MMVPIRRSLALGWLAAGLVVACARPKAAPSALPAAAPIDTTSLVRVRFARGTTSGIVDDSLAQGETRGYVLGALQGQVMLAHAIAWPGPRGGPPPGGAVVRVYWTADGRELSHPAGPGPLWSGRLPATGDYAVRVTAPDTTVGYTLAVQIPRRVVVDRENPTASFSGRAPSRAPVDYLIRVPQGQELEAEIRGRDSAAALHIYGLDDGKQLAPLGERHRRWSGRVPATQDYVVSVVPEAERADYELFITVR